MATAPSILDAPEIELELPISHYDAALDGERIRRSGETITDQAMRTGCRVFHSEDYTRLEHVITIIGPTAAVLDLIPRLREFALKNEQKNRVADNTLAGYMAAKRDFAYLDLARQIDRSADLMWGTPEP